jgi:hypothetical protein
MPAVLSEEHQQAAYLETFGSPNGPPKSDNCAQTFIYLTCGEIFLKSQFSAHSLLPTGSLCSDHVGNHGR